MSYVLDGIPTAMTARITDYAVSIRCLCGWQQAAATIEARRFHYEYCPKAKVPAPPCEHHNRRRLLGPGDVFTCLNCGTHIG